MMKFLFIAAPLVLSAAAPTASDDRLMAGYWVMTTHMAEIDLPEQSAEFVEELVLAMGPQIEVNYRCLSEEEAADPGLALFETSEPDFECSYPVALVEAGSVSVQAICTSPETGEVSMEIEGFYELMAIRGTLSATTVDNPEFGPMIMRGTMNAQYIGDCPVEDTAIERGVRRNG